MKKILVSTIVLLISVAGFSQQKGTNDWRIDWQFGLPVGNNFVTAFSALGFNLGYSKFIKQDLAVGLELGWNNYYQYAPKKTYTQGNEAVTTDLYKYIYTFPMTATIMKTFHAGEVFSPYVKLGLGGQYSEQNIYYNVYETTNDNWGFVVTPEIGAHVHFSKNNPWSLHAAVRYSWSTNAAKNLGVNNVQSVNFLLGIACTVL